MSWWGLVLNVASTKISVVSAKNDNNRVMFKKNKDREKIHDPKIRIVKKFTILHLITIIITICLLSTIDRSTRSPKMKPIFPSSNSTNP